MISSTLIFAWTALVLVVVVRADVLKIGVSEWMSSENGTVVLDEFRIFVAATAAQYVLAVKYFNERNTTVVPDLARISDCPHNISLVRMCDDGAMRLKASRDVRDFILAESVHALVGYAETLVSESASLLAETLGSIPIVSNWAQGNSLSDKSTFPNFARTWPTDRQYLDKTLSLIDQLKYTKLGVLYLNTDSGPSFVSELIVALSAKGVSVSSFGFTPYDGVSIDRAVEVLAKSGTNVILAMMYTDDIIAFLADAAAKHGLLSTHLWIFTYMDLNPFPEQLAANSNLSSLMFGSLRLQHASTTTSLFGAYLSDIWVNHTPAIALEINDKLPPFGTEDDTRCVNSDLDAQILNTSTFFQESAYIGLDVSNWPETFDTILALGFAACANYTDMPQKADLYASLMSTNFSGMSGQVRFDRNGDRLDESLAFILYNWDRLDDGEAFLSSSRFGFSLDSQAFVLSEQVRFRAGYGMAHLPPDIIIPSENRNQLGGLIFLGLFELALLNLICVGSIIWIIWKRHEKVVHNSQPEMTVLVVAGCLIASWALLFLSIEDGADDTAPAPPISLNQACHAAPLLFCFGFQLAFVALIAKTMRVALIFNNPMLRKQRYITLPRVLVLISVVIGAELVLLAIWTGLYPLEYNRLVLFRDVNEFPLESVGRCLPTSEASTQFLVAVFSLHAIMLVGCAYAANKVKQAPEKYHDSKYIAIAVASIAQAYLIAVPVVVSVYSEPIGRYLVLTSIVFLSALFLWLASVFPKIYLYYTGNQLITFVSTSQPNSPGTVAAAPQPPVSSPKAHRSSYVNGEQTADEEPDS